MHLNHWLGLNTWRLTKYRGDPELMTWPEDIM